MNLMADYRNLPIRHKLRFIIMTTVTAALAFAGTATLLYDQIDYRDEMRDDLRVAYELSRLLRNRRMKRGALDFDLPEAKVVILTGAAHS